MPELPYRNRQLPITQRIVDLMARMTLEEKCGQLQSQIVWGPAKKHERRAEVGHMRDLAHFMHSADHRATPMECATVINEDQCFAIENSRLGIPVLQNEESLHGALWGDATLFPQAIALAGTWNVDLVRRAADVIGKEMRAVGCRQTFAPVVNIARDSRWGRAQETYGEDPFLSARMGVAYVQGIETNNVVATPKHFVANVGDGGRDSNAVHFTERYLREIDLYPFEACFKEGKARGVMPSYNSIDGTPCSSSQWLLTDLLRTEWGFTGIVVSDYGGVEGIARAHRVAKDYPEACKKAIEAGMDVELPAGGVQLQGLVERGELNEAFIDRAVERVLRLKFELGLFEEPYVDANAADKLVRCKDHVALALEAGRQAITLLKNENQILPLSKNIQKLGIFGPGKDILSLGDYSGPYGGIWGGKDGVTPLAGIRKIVSPATQIIVQQPGQDAAALAKNCDAAFIFTAIEEAEASDRSDLSLPHGKPGDSAKPESLRHAIVVDVNQRQVELGQQVELIQAIAATGTPTIVVLLNGSAVTMAEWINAVPAVVEAWYPGEQGGTAIAEVLFGDYNPAGRLPITFPKTVAQVPLYYNYKPSGRGYAYNDNDGKPQFPFGFGLSYTTFAYSNLRLAKSKIHPIESATVRVEITNTGQRPGDEVVQLYIHDELATVARPVKELRGFIRVHLRAGETKTVTLTLEPPHLALWNAGMKFVVEPGTFKIMVGASSEDIRVEALLEVV